MTKSNIVTVLHKQWGLFDHRGSLLLLYAVVIAITLGLALTLEFGARLSPATVLLVILPISVLLLLGMPHLLAKSAYRREELRETRRGSNPAST
jgi:uncharacterized membrane protein YfcA